MKLEMEIDGRVMETEFSAAGGSARLVRDGKSYEAELSEPEPGLFVVILNDRVYRCSVESSIAGTEIIVNGSRIPVNVRDTKHLRSGAGGAAGSGGRATIIAPMPGKVVRVLVAQGDEVSAHQGVLVVEAMKMQNEVQSPKTGKVAEIRVSEGQAVNAGDLLAIID